MAVTNGPEGVLFSALNTWLASVLGADTFHADVQQVGLTNFDQSGPRFDQA
jgi:hypothetical protein